ncbi:hypothetical protein D3C75_463560 [compost metagenome]
MLQQRLYLVHKAHVEHAVRLVEHQMAEVPKAQGPLTQMVEQSTRGGDQQIHPVFQRLHLGGYADPAVHQGAGEIRALPVAHHALKDLHRQLAGRHQHQGADGAGRLALRLLHQLLQQRQHEGGGLAGAGLSPRQQIPPRQNDGDGAGLNGGWRGITQLTEGLLQTGREGQFGKGGNGHRAPVWGYRGQGRDGSGLWPPW